MDQQMKNAITLEAKALLSAPSSSRVEIHF
jgi:hypothetical protein